MCQRLLIMMIMSVIVTMAKIDMILTTIIIIIIHHLPDDPDRYTGWGGGLGNLLSPLLGVRPHPVLR